MALQQAHFHLVVYCATFLYYFIEMDKSPCYYNTTWQLDKWAWIETGLRKQKFYFIQHEAGSNFFGRPVVP